MNRKKKSMSEVKKNVFMKKELKMNESASEPEEVSEPEEALESEETKEEALTEEERAQLEAEYREMLDKSYILHTAMITCSYAYTTESYNPSYIVVPASHGETIHGMPQLNIKDSVSDVNVLNFGICRSPKNPAVQAKAREILDEVQEEASSWTDRILGLFVDKDNKDVCDAENGENGELQSLAACCAAECKPEICMCWTDGKDDVHIDGEPALLGKGTLSCLYGGTIIIQSSGQPE